MDGIWLGNIWETIGKLSWQLKPLILGFSTWLVQVLLLRVTSCKYGHTPNMVLGLLNQLHHKMPARSGSMEGCYRKIIRYNSGGRHRGDHLSHGDLSMVTIWFLSVDTSYKSLRDTHGNGQSLYSSTILDRTHHPHILGFPLSSQMTILGIPVPLLWLVACTGWGISIMADDHIIFLNVQQKQCIYIIYIHVYIYIHTPHVTTCDNM